MIQGAARIYAHHFQDILPPDIKEKFQLPDLAESILRIHCPQKDDQMDHLNDRRSIFQGISILSF